MRANKLSFDDFKVEFVYDEKSPSYLSRVVNGDIFPVTSKNKKGYYRVSFKNKKYYVHRIIWLLKNPSYDQTLDIDHRDLNKSNNEISNLRLVTRSINLKNKNQTAPEHKNIHWDKTRNRFQVYYQENGKRKSTAFTEKKYHGKASALTAALNFRSVLIENGFVVLTEGDK